jgi:hypothetical protein
MRIKESNVHTFMEVHCRCGQSDGPEWESHMRWFKVDGVQTCEDCMKDYLRWIEEALED